MPNEDHWFFREFGKKKGGRYDKNQQAYRGYLIGYDVASERFTIEKDGTRISSSERSFDAAKSTVDELAG